MEQVVQTEGTFFINCGPGQITKQSFGLLALPPTFIVFAEFYPKTASSICYEPMSATRKENWKTTLPCSSQAFCSAFTFLAEMLLSCLAGGEKLFLLNSA